MSRENQRKKSKKFSEYYLGLDIGTDSIGWCVTDPQYNVLKFNGKAMWGIRLFDEAEPAAGRRAIRCSRRRLHRQKQRISLLEELLSNEVAKVDPVFFMRLRESKFYIEDKNEVVRQKYALFADENFTDVDYYKEFPTIHHLKWALMNHKEKFDIRLYYLAISHMMKHRGHFLFSGSVNEATSFETVYDSLKEYTENELGFTLECEEPEILQKLLLDKSISKIDKKKQLAGLFRKLPNPISETMKKEALNALSGSTVKLETLFGDETLRDQEIVKFSFADGTDEEKEEQLNNVLGERFEYFAKLKAVYDWATLTNILSGCSSISEAQVQSFEKHKKDLKELKYAVKKYLPESYYEIFSADDKKDNYASYVRHAAARKGTVAPKRITEQKDFCDYIRKKFEKIDAEDEVIGRIKSETANYTFMPKQRAKSNSAIPYQVHEMDLKKILEHMGEDYPELAEQQADGFSVCEKIHKMFRFRIPYYVGPLNGYHKDKGGNSWVVRKESGKVLPWNFEDKVDVKASAGAFKARLTNKCTYILGKDVLPKNSLLYSRYMVLNELNNVRIDGTRLPVELKQRIYEEVFKRRSGKYSLKKLKEWLMKENVIGQDALLSGVDGIFQATLKSYQDFYKIIGNRVETEPLMVEDIIKNILIFGEDKRMLRELISEKYSDRLSDSEIQSISKLTYSGWGRFSQELLNGITDVNHETGELLTIIQAMWEGQENFMELMSSRHGYMQEIQKSNGETSGKAGNISYELVQESYASPAVKRGIWQTLLIVKELQKVTKNNPARIFVEVARSREEDPKRKASRKAKLLETYKAIKNEEKDWVSEIESRDEREFQSKKLYLYYMQMGRDMYSGQPIDLGELFTNSYDIDHIYPQSKTKDDSILNNLVLVRSEENRDKGDEYPVPDKFRQTELWRRLLDKGFITKEKYGRLIRRTSLSDEELASFIGRQLVETRQSTKVVAQILEQTLPDTKIIYSKANAVSQFRQEKGFIKSRAVNDYHHAKDAYLNIVVGNVYYTKFTDNPVRYIREEVRKSKGKEQYSLNHMFDFDVARNGKTAWKRGSEGTIVTVRKQMGKNNILFTRYATEKRGGFYDQMLLRKGSGQLRPIKTEDGRYDTERYGGYNKPSINYFMLVESDDKKGRKRTLEGVPVYFSGASEEELIEFCRDELNLKNPDIRLHEIRINALLKLDGYPMHISGKSGNSILMKNGVQLCLSSEMEKIIHHIEKVVEKSKVDKNYQLDEHDKLTDAKLVEIYDCLFAKATTGIFAQRPASQVKTMKNGREKFVATSLIEKCVIINEILHLFQCNASSANLKLIGGVGRAGVFKVSSKISSQTEAKLISQSVTGLFEQVIDLKTV